MKIPNLSTADTSFVVNDGKNMIFCSDVVQKKSLFK